jgi:hypothetical protein
VRRGQWPRGRGRGGVAGPRSGHPRRVTHARARSPAHPHPRACAHRPSHTLARTHTGTRNPAHTSTHAHTHAHVPARPHAAQSVTPGPPPAARAAVISRLQAAQGTYVASGTAANLVLFTALLTPGQVAEWLVQSHPYVPT